MGSDARTPVIETGTAADAPPKVRRSVAEPSAFGKSSPLAESAATGAEKRACTLRVRSTLSPDCRRPVTRSCA